MKLGSTTTATTSVDDWFAETPTQDIGSYYAAKHSAPDHDFRTVMWARQYELLSDLNPDWASRWVRELADRLRRSGFDRDIELQGPAGAPAANGYQS